MRPGLPLLLLLLLPGPLACRSADPAAAEQAEAARSAGEIEAATGPVPSDPDGPGDAVAPFTADTKSDFPAGDAGTSNPADPATFEIGRSVGDRPIEATVYGSTRNERVLILASIHGDEPSGTPLLAELDRYLRQNPVELAERCVMLIPVANPDGYEARTRRNGNGIDLNRNFPASNYRPGRNSGAEPLSEPETQALFGMLHSFQPARVVSIHMETAQIDYDGPSRELAEAMAAHCRLLVRRQGSRPGSLGSYVGLDLGTPIVTLELTPKDHRRDADELWQRYGQALLAAIRLRAAP